MDIYESSKKLDKIKHFQKTALIVTVVFGIAVITYSVLLSLPRIGDFLLGVPYLLLMIFWIIVLSVPLIPIVLLISSPNIRKLHPAVRYKTILNYITYTWVLFFSGLLLYEVTEGIRDIFFVVIPFIVSGIILVVIFWMFRRKYTKKSETMFP
jgi:hypothetical protein